MDRREAGSRGGLLSFRGENRRKPKLHLWLWPMSMTLTLLSALAMRGVSPARLGLLAVHVLLGNGNLRRLGLVRKLTRANRRLVPGGALQM
jgi:hypothetical protein